jgi:hypothetical protein
MCLKEGHRHIYVQENNFPYQQSFPTQYRLTEEEMGNIMSDWDDEWNIPTIEKEPSKQPNLKVYDINKVK